MESNIYSVLAPGPILREIGLYLDISDIVSLSRTCTGLSAVYRELMRYHWNVDSMLKRFFKQPKTFRQQLARSDALIFGSFAFEYFQRSEWEAQDLDVIVSDGNGAVSLMTHILDEQGYQIWKDEDTQPFKHVQRVVDFAQSPEKEARKVRVYVTSDVCFPVRAITEGCSVTAVANFISWDMAYSMFPNDTFLRGRSFFLKWKGPDEDFNFVEKYAFRGMIFETIVPSGAEGRSTAIRRVRKIDDRLTWRIPLNTDDIEPSQRAGLTESADHVSMSLLKDFINAYTLDGLRCISSQQVDEEFVHHWDVKYMRYCGWVY